MGWNNWLDESLINPLPHTEYSYCDGSLCEYLTSEIQSKSIEQTTTQIEDMLNIECVNFWQANFGIAIKIYDINFVQIRLA